MFAGIAAVLRYNMFSRITADLICRISGIPTIGCFDDIGAPANLAKMGMRNFPARCKLFGNTLRLGKPDVSPHIAFLVRLVPFPTIEGGVEIRLALTPVKSGRWSEIIRRHLQAGVISHRGIDNLIGKLRFRRNSFSASLLARNSEYYTGRYAPLLINRALHLTRF